MCGIVFNEDNSEFYITHAPEDMTEAGLDAWLDTYVGTQVQELLLCPNSMRSSVASAARESVWEGFDLKAGNDQPFFAGMRDRPWFSEEGARAHMRRWVSNALLLHQRGIDPYAYWIRGARARGLSPWLSMRMNDVHYVDEPEHPIHDRFWREHPEYQRAPWRLERWDDRALDYGRPEVRAYEMAYLRELVERYDIDGFELDWMRFGYLFRPGCEETGAAALTEFIAEVRGLLNRRAQVVGHSIRLGARVPARPETARKLGMDASHWARRGLVDMLTVGPFLFLDSDIPVELWKQLLEGTGVTLAAGLEAYFKPYPGAPEVLNSLETVRGAASSFLHRGADRIYLFNCFGASYRRMLEEVGSLKTMSANMRRHVLTYTDFWPADEPYAAPLPRQCAGGRSVEFRIHIGPAPVPGQQGQVRLAFEACGTAAPGCVPPIDLAVRVNGCAAPPNLAAPLLSRAILARGRGNPTRRGQSTGGQSLGGWAPPGEPAGTHTYAPPPGALHAGHNVVEVCNRSQGDARVVWMEIALSAADGGWALAQPHTPIL